MNQQFLWDYMSAQARLYESVDNQADKEKQWVKSEFETLRRSIGQQFRWFMFNHNKEVSQWINRDSFHRQA